MPSIYSPPKPYDDSALVARCAALEEAAIAQEYGAIKVGDTEVSLTNYFGLGGDVVVPSVVLGLPVTSLGARPGASPSPLGPFFQNQYITSCVIPDSVTQIAASSFGGCANLASVTLPKNLSTLEQYVLADCVKLTSVVVPATVTSMEAWSLGGCTLLKKVYFEGDAPTYHDYALTSTPTIYIHAGAQGFGNVGDKWWGNTVALW